MNVEELLQVLDPRPKYDGRYEDLLKFFTEKRSYSNFQIYLVAFIIGIHLDKCELIERNAEKKDIYPLNMWSPKHLKDIVYYLLLKRSSTWGYDWMTLENADQDLLDIFKREFAKNMDGYANAGLRYIKEQKDNDPVLFNQPFALIDLLHSVISEKACQE